MTDSSIIAVLSASHYWLKRLKDKNFGGSDSPIPTLLTQAVVEKGKKTSKGEIIIAVTSVWNEIIELIIRDPSIIYKIDPRKLEEIIAGMHKRTGLFDKVTLTPRSGDHGRDVIVEKYGRYALRFIDQVKAYRPGHLVSAEEIRSTIGALHGDNTQKAIVTTTSDFAPKIMDDPAIKALHPYRLELVNGVELSKRVKELGKKE